MNMKKTLALTLSLAMLVGATTLSASAAYYDGKTEITFDNALTTGNADHGGGKQDSSPLAEGSTVGTGNVDVKIETSTSATITHVYAIAYSTTELSYTYGATNYVWNPEDQVYDLVSSGDTWSNNGGNTITVTNYSDLPVDVTATFQKETAITDNITANFADSNTLKLASAVTDNTDITSQGTPTSNTFTVSLTGSATKPYGAGTKLGTITLTVKVPTSGG